MAHTQKTQRNSPRRFTHEDRKSHGLKIQITECDKLTRRALERQAVACGCSVEEFILDGALCSLASNEELTFVDPKTGEVVAGTGDFGNYIGCNVDQNASEPPPPHFTRIPIPPGRLLKLAPKTVISISAFCSRYWVGVIFFGLAEGMFASPTLDALVNAAASFSDAIGQQLVFIQNEPAPAEFSEKTIAYAKRKRPISRPYGRRCPN